ncbi:MAG: precorrin-6Y C5,15-methyltransferase (decarboxylating) subunit CbiT [Candidatus Methanoperedens sp.]|nr:precorrin-6Y C5,15-methyltransferase (decarboxylating) subunit CbiT [Candidatus Methanoperedens sp.]
MRYPRGTPTQPEIIAVALSKLDLKPDDVFADIGCGSGSVSISVAGLVQLVHAIDNRNEAISATEDNIKEFGINNIKVIKGEASELLADLYIDCAFVGGSGNLEKVLEILMEKTRRFVVSAVRVETMAEALRIMKQTNKFKELIQVQVSRGSELAGGTMFKHENPVFLIVGGKEC